MALIDIVGQASCAGAGGVATGTKYCHIDINRITTFGFLQRNYKFSDGDIETQAGIRLLQQQEKLIILNGARSVTYDTPADNIKTYDGSGEKSVISKMPYELTATFENGLYFAKQIEKLNSNKRYDLVMWDNKGTCFIARNLDSTFGGLKTIMVNTNPYMPGGATDTAYKTITVQLDREQFDNNIDFIELSNLDYNADLDLDGYNDVTLSFSPLPSAGDTTIFVKVTANSDRNSHFVDGLVKDDLYYTVNGNVQPVLQLDQHTVHGHYAVGVLELSANAEISLQLRQFNAPLAKYLDIVDVDGLLLKSNKISATAL